MNDVDENYHVQPLIHYYQSKENFIVLALAKDQYNFYWGQESKGDEDLNITHTNGCRDLLNLVSLKCLECNIDVIVLELEDMPTDKGIAPIYNYQFEMHQGFYLFKTRGVLFDLELIFGIVAQIHLLTIETNNSII